MRKETVTFLRWVATLVAVGCLVFIGSGINPNAFQVFAIAACSWRSHIPGWFGFEVIHEHDK